MSELNNNLPDLNKMMISEPEEGLCEDCNTVYENFLEIIKAMELQASEDEDTKFFGWLAKMCRLAHQ